MSKKTVQSVAPVSADQFTTALEHIAHNGKAIKAEMQTAARYIAQCTTKKDQDAAKKALAKAYQELQASLTGKAFKLESAQTWVQRNVKALSGNDKFKWLQSKTANAAKKRAARQAKAETPAEVKAEPKKPQTTIEQLRNALIAKETQIADEFRGVIPSGKIKEFDQAFAAFIQTLNIILK